MTLLAPLSRLPILMMKKHTANTMYTAPIADPYRSSVNSAIVVRRMRRKTGAMIQYSGVMKRFFHWYQIAEAPRLYTAPASDTGISACVPTLRLWAIITHGPKRRSPRKYSAVRRTRKPTLNPMPVMTTRYATRTIQSSGAIVMGSQGVSHPESTLQQQRRAANASRGLEARHFVS